MHWTNASSCMHMPLLQLEIHAFVIWLAGTELSANTETINTTTGVLVSQSDVESQYMNSMWQLEIV